MNQIWAKHLGLKMQEAGKLEKELAIEKEDVMAIGTPYIKVIVDGG